MGTLHVYSWAVENIHISAAVNWWRVADIKQTIGLTFKHGAISELLLWLLSTHLFISFPSLSNKNPQLESNPLDLFPNLAIPKTEEWSALKGELGLILKIKNDASTPLWFNALLNPGLISYSDVTLRYRAETTSPLGTNSSTHTLTFTRTQSFNI